MLLDSPKKKNIAIVFAGVISVILILFLHRIFSGRLILTQGFGLGPLFIRYYGLLMSLAVLAGMVLALRRAPKYGIGPEYAVNALFWAVVGGFLGARLYHVLSEPASYLSHPLSIFFTWRGGLGIYGAIAGGLAALWSYFYAKRKPSLPFLRILDWLTPSLVLGQVIGRFGNLFNYEAFGAPTGLPWKMFVPPMFRPGEFLNQVYFHPLFFYEAAGNAAILILLLFWERKKTAPGFLFFSYLLLYNVLRFFLEWLRLDSVMLGPVKLNILTSGALIVAVLAILIYRKKNVQIS